LTPALTKGQLSHSGKTDAVTKRGSPAAAMVERFTTQLSALTAG
jgi:hypothetical protein